MPLPLLRPFPDVVHLWRCPICNHESFTLADLGRHMGKTNHGVVVVKNDGAEREAFVLMTPLNNSLPEVLPLPSILRGVE